MANSTKKYLGENGLLYFWQKIKDAFVSKDGYVAYTTAEKTKLSGIAQGAEVNTVSTVKVNGSALTPTNKAVDISVPTNTNQLTNGAGFQTGAQVTSAIEGYGYQTSAQVQSAINSALSGITGIDFQIVSSLPATGAKGVIYLVSNGGSGNNSYDEYIWLSDTSKFEKIGTTDIDLSGYLLASDVVEITNAEIDTVVSK